MEEKLFGELMTSVREAGRIARGTARPARIHTKGSQNREALRKRFKASQLVRLRQRLKLSQAQFAGVMLISVATLQSWEQGRRRPEGPALVLIRVMSKIPETVAKVLHGS
jgi:putative transcriptional regulator